ncbi:NAD(P)/FAD-dependent oxidoreductase [Algirhabdus cladophorae]|uniref:NAD(P)/FAD-dependent oxidoreductase n=1 Tax=Algirhabdus cladophorae TaxID=3377108 RepID=UPI003B84B2B8
MPLETSAFPAKRIAVIGAGISGLGAAHMLAKDHKVVVFEAEDRVGGHARTKMAGPNRDVAVDTGFIVFNYANYPYLTALFDELDVPVAKSDMSFGASIDGGRIEYGLASLRALFAQKRNWANPMFLRMVSDILYFNKHAERVAQDKTITVGELLQQLGTGKWFRDYYLLPFSGAIWSTPKNKIMDFPAHAMVQFFKNHALLNTTGQHQWYTVQGGSIEYVRRLEASLRGRGVEFRLSADVQSVTRSLTGAQVKTVGAPVEEFDEVIMATHSDQALALLGDASPQEASALRDIRYQPNDVVLHSDEAIMPKRRGVWSSWMYTESPAKRDDTIDLTYWMNSLQPVASPDNYFVTLNSTRPIQDALIWDTVTLHHPVYDTAMMAAQERVKAFNGTNRTWFCGAWMKNGFHEDGLSSAVDVVEAIRPQYSLSVAAE